MFPWKFGTLRRKAVPEDRLFWVRFLGFCSLPEEQNKEGWVTEAHIFQKTFITLGFQSRT